jgi:hypothetical protein
LIRAAGQSPRPHNRPRHRLRAELQLDARALQLIEHGAQRLLAADREWKLLELFCQWLTRIVAQAGNLPGSLLLDGQRLQDVVHLARFEIEPRRFTRAQTAGSCEIADTVLEKHNLADRKFSGRGNYC